MSTDLTQGQALLHASQRSQATLAALAQPTALRFDLPQGYAGSLYRCAPLAPASIGNLSTWLTQQFWRNQNPALHDDLRTLAAAGDNLPALLADIQAGGGGLLGRLFGGQKRRAAEAASAVLAERLASASGALTRLEPIFAQADQLAALTPEAAFASNTLGLKDAAAPALARYAGETWAAPHWEEIPTAEHAAFLKYLGRPQYPPRTCPAASRHERRHAGPQS